MTHPWHGETQNARGAGNVCCESTLRQIGVGEAFIAKKLKEQLEAKQRRWNPERKEYELFADNDARRAAVREVIKILGSYPSEHGPRTIRIYEGTLGELRWRRRLKQGDVAVRVPEIAPVVPANAVGAPEKVTCASALRQIGVDGAFIAKKLMEQLEAKQPRWNPKKKEYELVADNDARRAAISEVVKILGGYPSDETEGGESTVIVKRGWSPAWEKAHKHGSVDSKVPRIAPEAPG